MASDFDKSGSGLKIFLEQKEELQIDEIKYAVVPDVKESIKAHLKEWSKSGIDVVLTVGGTGCSVRDVTPEATREVIEKEMPGLSLAMLINSIKTIPMAMLSRSVCGIKDKTLIINLPGNSNGSLECFKVILPVLQHAVDLIHDKKDSIRETHAKLQEQHSRHSIKIHVPHLLEADVHHVQQGHQHDSGDGPLHHHLDHHHAHHQQYLHHHHRRHRYPSQSSPHFGSDDGHSVVDENRVAMRLRKSNYPILNVDDALDIVLKEILAPVVESVPYDQCLRRIVACDVLAESCLPPFNASIKDGYAVIAGDGIGLRKVVGDVIAGSLTEAPLESGQCYRISTGAPIPSGADSVVQVEDTKLVSASDDGMEEVEVEILVPPNLGQDIRCAGCDIGLKECILKPGMKVGPAEVGLLASAGNMSINCFKKPLIGILSTGNELVEPEGGVIGGKIRDCNRPMLMAALSEHGFSATDLGVAADKAATLLSCFKSALESVDIIISTGGVSMGEKDLVKRVLTEDLEASIHFGRVFMKPGKPMTFSTFQHKGQKKYFFGLPGNPVSALVTFHLFVLPALRKMSGDPNPRSLTIKARLSESMKLDERPEYHRCVLDWTSPDGIPLASSTGNQLSSRLLSMRSAQGLLKLPSTNMPPQIMDEGCIVDCILFNKI